MGFQSIEDTAWTPDSTDVDISVYLRLMVHKNASDLFITAGIAPSLKIHGKITPLSQIALTPEQARDMVYSVMPQAQRQEFEETLECNFAIHPKDVGRFRINVFQQQNYIGMVARKIETRIPTIEELKLPALLHELAMTPRGLIFFVGATGVGKSTSLAAMIGSRNRYDQGHIICIEDPIEFVHDHDGCIVTQREVGLDTESYEQALKNALRQAPDVILVGEIRSRETMEHAITFAETGHLCLSTLHAKNAEQALERIINIFPKENRDQVLMDLSLNLSAIVAQRLVPTEDGKGLRAVVEILINTPLVSDLIQKGELNQIKEVMKKCSQHGMTTFDDSAYELFSSGEISYDSAIEAADSANEVRLKIKLCAQSAGREQRNMSGLEAVNLFDPSIR
ncbi:MAG: PilT/PilU family type 4a pilus ATPase [Gammaproteobacteria bacterium]|nr:PilT/PilU family type 4a pilus ATPase [Gammaproteobacteria bacterium]